MLLQANGSRVVFSQMTFSGDAGGNVEIFASAGDGNTIHVFETSGQSTISHDTGVDWPDNTWRTFDIIVDLSHNTLTLAIDGVKRVDGAALTFGYAQTQAPIVFLGVGNVVGPQIASTMALIDDVAFSRRP
jgi:hypothetical protein